MDSSAARYSLFTVHFSFQNCRAILVTVPARHNELRQDLQDKAKELNSILHIANGYYDHIHMLVSLPPTLSVSTAIKHFKGFTSHAIPELFWQNGYYAFTIDQRAFETIFGYIKNQWAHHEKQSLIDELDILIATGLNPWQ